MPDPAPRKSSMNRPGYLEVSDEYAGQRVDNFLIRELKGVPKTRLYRALRKGEVRVNKGRVKADYRLQVGDRVRIPPIRMAPGKPIRPPPAHWLGLDKERTLYEDRGLLVINKPAGLAVHGGSGLTIGLIESLRLMRSGDNYLELVHRLDRETSGCLMVARRAAVLKELHRQLREDRIDKRYLALVEGMWPRQLRDVEAPLLKNTLRSRSTGRPCGQSGQIRSYRVSGGAAFCRLHSTPGQAAHRPNSPDQGSCAACGAPVVGGCQVFKP